MKKNKNENSFKRAKEFLQTSPYLLWLMLILITALFTITHHPKQSQTSYSYSIGDVAKRDIKAPKNFFVEDKKATSIKIDEVKESVKNIYDFDANLLNKIHSNIDTAIKIPKELFNKTNEQTPEPDPTFAIILDTKSEFEEKLGIEISKGAYSILYKDQFSSDMTEKIKTIIEKILTNGIVANKEILLKETHKGIILRTIGSKEERIVNNLKVFYGPDQAKTMVRIEGEPLLKGINYNLSNLIVDLCQRLLQPNITLNKNETEKRIKEAETNIKPILYQIKTGEMILREGERVDKVQLIKLMALQAQVKEKNIFISSTGIALITFFTILVVYLLFLKDHKKLHPAHNKHIFFLALGLVLYLTFAKFSTYIAQSANPDATWDISSLSFFLIIPIPSAAMLTCLFLGFDIAIFFTIILSLLTSLVFSGNFEVFIFFFLSSITAAYWIKARQARKNFIIAGFKLAIFNGVLAISIGFYSLAQPDVIILAKEVAMAFCGGLFSATLTIGFAPLIEVIFDYTTDSKLLEFSNLDQPLIKKLMIEAPGTYNHSVIVATLAEAAASAIDVSSLKAKVMGYYHDIGKLDKKLYYIENQADGKNRHDKLSPSMSALILIGHVKNGVEMAKKYKLGNEIIDGIIQHHGTSLIKYFYQKSLNSGNDTVKEENFRYPGPKPQTREAGIVMLADVVEAAVRALERPTPARIQGRVKELINDIFADGQLEECELTLKDLHQIAKSFNNILTSIYHSRIEYPDKIQEKKKEKNGSSKSTDRQSANKENTNGHNPAKDKTDLKRLGL
ncbi:MAG: HDIG domain-containing protein [Desulfobacula sp.]|jgi:putative nucleotidyltransferase with HDIG domain|uniref:HD family phosphohydrolase n=1 Tax=Desulfobacula sp. TaxID=2593537 RepID=UPI001D9BBCD4|nr:HDIG domain-containing protein [Desulfobacula sp.]MBT3487353.1 HDIG domain-containing protein [Desulfobacula sp.]MBT3806585.1 HDIG domain-containing protein [Desulfobacula sp.]MBT4026919.1 HDIG domain-containing protein [Desulfobacula sp.]MBT4200709.1 HDIG domain-containing protein [Desulfobacula sp.]